jgi:hypothetical protein
MMVTSHNLRKLYFNTEKFGVPGAPSSETRSIRIAQRWSTVDVLVVHLCLLWRMVPPSASFSSGRFGCMVYGLFYDVSISDYEYITPNEGSEI